MTDGLLDTWPTTNTEMQAVVASASEDGSVRLWDARLKKPCTATLVPSARSELARGRCGQWVGAACLTSDWVVRKYNTYSV